jgi:hypothetical protein
LSWNFFSLMILWLLSSFIDHHFLKASAPLHVDDGTFEFPFSDYVMWCPPVRVSFFQFCDINKLAIFLKT